MNKERAKKIGVLADELEAFVSRISDLQSEEQDAYDNLPESFQNGEKGETMQTAIDVLSEAQGEVEQVVENLRGIEGV